jgi:hypothetical protein
MPARSVLSKHIPHLATWSVSTAFLSYLGSAWNWHTRVSPLPCATARPQ